MFKPEAMTRLVLLGAKNDVVRTIELLHRLEVAHIIDYVPDESEKDLQLGSPSEKSSLVSKNLLKLRASAKVLDLNKETGEVSSKISENTIVKQLDSTIEDLEENILSLAETKTRLEEHFNKLYERIISLQPFTDFAIPLDDYHGYGHVAVFAGCVTDFKKLETELTLVTDEYELFHSASDESGNQTIALFLSKTYADQGAKILGDCGFNPVILPEGAGLPQKFIGQWAVQTTEISKRLETMNDELAGLRKRYADFILASEEYLSIEVQKAEAPVRFATTAHSFIIDCWVPSHQVDMVKKTIENDMKGMIYVEEYEALPVEEPPVLLKNPRPVKHFEFFLDLYSMPNYRDVDPSFILAMIFPLFFGFMIGDIGYGILLFLVGIIFIKKFKTSETITSIGWTIIIAGIFATIFGLFVFGDMFGLSFQTPPGAVGVEATANWSYLLHTPIPITSLIHKMESNGLTQLLLLSIIAGFLHLGLGLLFGLISEWKHEKKHAVGKIGLFFILCALVILIFVMADWTVGHWLLPLKQSSIGPTVWTFFINPLKTGITFGGIVLPYSSIVLGVSGILVLLVTTGGLGLIEVFEITGHLVSYTRLAALCVAKGAMAFAFNIIVLQMVASGNGNIVIFALGLVLIVVLQLIVFTLGSLSSGIQALRLHYVEFFMKFYKGGGTKFNPFRYERKYTIAE